MNENIPPQQPQYVPTQRPESGTVTALAVVSIIFGTIGLLGSFIPCLGAFAIWIAVPAALCGAGATFMAKSKGCSIGFPVAAFVVSILGVIISAVQILALSATVKAANDSVHTLEDQIKQDTKARQEEVQKEKAHQEEVEKGKARQNQLQNDNTDQ